MENGTVVGIKVDPLNKKSYFDQVSELAEAVIPVDEVNNTKRRKRFTIRKDDGGEQVQENCYLRQWMIDEGIYEENREPVFKKK